MNVRNISFRRPCRRPEKPTSCSIFFANHIRLIANHMSRFYFRGQDPACRSNPGHQRHRIWMMGILVLRKFMPADGRAISISDHICVLCHPFGLPPTQPKFPAHPTKRERERGREVIYISAVSLDCVDRCLSRPPNLNFPPTHPKERERERQRGHFYFRSYLWIVLPVLAEI